MRPKTPRKRNSGPKTDRHGRKLSVVASNDPPMKRFIANVPETEFAEALEAATDPKIAQFMAARMDVAYRGVSFSALCRKFNVSLQDIDDIWRNHQLHEGMIRMMNHVPQLMDDIGEDAKSKLVLCERCDGQKQLTDDETHVVRPCPVCEGVGKVRVWGSKAARDLVFESIGLIGKKGPAVAIQQNNFGLDSSLEEVLMSTSKLLGGDVRDVQAQAVKEETNP